MKKIIHPERMHEHCDQILIWQPRGHEWAEVIVGVQIPDQIGSQDWVLFDNFPSSMLLWTRGGIVGYLIVISVDDIFAVSTEVPQCFAPWECSSPTVSCSNC